MEQRKRILVIEDSLESQNLVKRALYQKFDVKFCTNLREARSAIIREKFNLVLLDRNLPDGDGADFCSELYESGTSKKSPVIMVTARGDIEDKMRGFGCGADDYIPKPFDSRELVARIESVLRRNWNLSEEMDLGDLRINFIDQKVYKIENSDTSLVDLTPIEFKILSIFARSQNKIVKRDELFREVWGNQIHLNPRNIDTHVCKLRQKLNSEEFVIQSVRGSGYTAQVHKSVPTEIIVCDDYDLLLPKGRLPS